MATERISPPKKRTTTKRSKRPKDRTRGPVRLNKTSSRLSELTGQISLQATIEENYRRFKPVFLLFGIIISVYLGLSLLSFRPEDLIDLETDNGNIGGVLGAKAAGSLLHHLGYGAWCVLPVGGMFAWKLAGRQIGGFWRPISTLEARL